MERQKDRRGYDDMEDNVDDVNTNWTDVVLSIEWVYRRC